MTMIYISAAFLLISGLFFVFFVIKYLRLKKTGALYSEIIEYSGDAVCVTDGRGKIEHVNPAFLSVTGYAREEVIGKNPRIMKSGRHGPEFYKKMWDSLKHEGKWQGEIYDKRKNGEVFPKILTIKAFGKGPGLKYIGIFSDVSIDKQRERHIERLTHYDPLTGLPNRMLLIERLNKTISSAEKNKKTVSVIAVDIEDFKKINNAFGLDAGDELLKAVARKLLEGAGKGDTVARTEGDEFVVVSADAGSEKDASHAARKIIEALSGPFKLKGKYNAFINVNMGIALYPKDDYKADGLILGAETALNRAVLKGEKFLFFKSSMHSDSFHSVSIETNLRDAFERGEFVLYYQPVIEAPSCRVIGMEALIRRKEPNWLAPPSSFIEIAEKSGLILPICEWTLKEATRQASKWQGGEFPPLRLAVNFTSMQFYQKDLARIVGNVLKETGFPPGRLELELTERTLMYDTETSIEVMKQLSDMGVLFSIDDFGTGYSSLSYLKKFPIHKLKIDISFVRELPGDPDSAAITRAIISLAHSLNLKVIAEGVENEAQFRFLRDNGCDEIQGFFFSIPLHPKQFEKLMVEDKGVIERVL